VRRSLGRFVRIVVHSVGGGTALGLYAIAIVPASRVRRLARRSLGRPPAILWGPTPVLNIRYSALADRLYGYRSDTLVYTVYRINARQDFDYTLDRFYRIPVLGELVPYAALLWSGLRYDVFGFFFDGGLLAPTPLWRFELPLVKAAGKGVVVYPYGGDARLATETRSLGPWHAYTDIPVGDEDRDEADVRRHLAVFGRWADVILGCADLVEWLPRHDGVLPYPIDADAWEPAPEADDGVVTVVHSPNHRHYKGTRFLIEAVDSLRAEGLPVELVLIEGMPNDVARRTYERADVVADQFLVGAYALFAIEGMALGKPVLCYLNDRFRQFHPEWDECPIVNTSPDDIADNLRRLVLDPALRAELGARGPGYVRTHHSLERVGAQMDAIYRSLWDGAPVRPFEPAGAR
jgi:glycosyltransferase involved in cell wall biosynthesis